MNRIRLNKIAKDVMKLLAKDVHSCPDYMLQSDFNSGACDLSSFGLAHCHQEENGNVEFARLSDKGKMYLKENPHLRNPINWGIVGAIASIITAIVALVALFIACSLKF